MPLKFCVICMENEEHEWDGQTWVCKVCGHRMSDALPIASWKEHVVAQKEREKTQHHPV